MRKGLCHSSGGEALVRPFPFSKTTKACGKKNLTLHNDQKKGALREIFFQQVARPHANRPHLGRSRVPVGSVGKHSSSFFSLLEHAGTRTNVRLHLLRKKKKRSKSCVAVLANRQRSR